MRERELASVLILWFLSLVVESQAGPCAHAAASREQEHIKKSTQPCFSLSFSFLSACIVFGMLISHMRSVASRWNYSFFLSLWFIVLFLFASLPFRSFYINTSTSQALFANHADSHFLMSLMSFLSSFLFFFFFCILEKFVHLWCRWSFALSSE